MADVADVAQFLAAYPPFTGLAPEQLESIAATVQERSYVRGETALVEDGAPASVFYVIARGSMELIHEEEVIDILEPASPSGTRRS
jgi:signal-transduction protein with cAMP-binding, CBS, and nucleotidyltransferase domain